MELLVLLCGWAAIAVACMVWLFRITSHYFNRWDRTFDDHR